MVPLASLLPPCTAACTGMHMETLGRMWAESQDCTVPSDES